MLQTKPVYAAAVAWLYASTPDSNLNLAIGSEAEVVQAIKKQLIDFASDSEAPQSAGLLFHTQAFDRAKTIQELTAFIRAHRHAVDRLDIDTHREGDATCLKYAAADGYQADFIIRRKDGAR